MTEAELRGALRALLLRNVKDGHSRLLRRHYCYVAPSQGTYPFQYFWDTCFHVIILSRLGEYELARRNLRSLFAMQEENGFVGHMVFWKEIIPKRHTDVLQARPSWQALRPHMSALIQPPFAAAALLCLFEACGDRVYLGEMYARIKRQHEWLAKNRDFDGDGLLTIISPFESGMDWKPSYDPVLGYAERRTPRSLLGSSLYWKGVHVDLCNFVLKYDLERIRRKARFLVKDAGVNAAYAHDLQAMEKLAGIIGDDSALYAARRRRVVDSMRELMYDERDCAFYDLQEPGSRKLRVLTPTIFFPLSAPEFEPELAERILERHFDGAGEFDTPLPVPSVDRRDAAFFAGETPFIWRGPVWAVNNWYVHGLLKKRGLAERADRLRKSLLSAIHAGGFGEYYDPYTGAGLGASEFTWSGLILDMS